ncbi:hypothetical protein [Burkholderia ubonensis]|uniref:hypothetical protein n=1 Tax=Burkholderia ubonensis TaxID=101571 RepID=UPI001054457B|nr:hypothetical protein [Burkholderia ubonensis]
MCRLNRGDATRTTSAISPATSGRTSTIRELPLYIRLMGNRVPIRVEQIALDRTGPVSFVTHYDFSATTIAEMQARRDAAAA